MANKLNSNKKLSDECKPNFNLLTNLSSEIKLWKNYRLKFAPNDEKFSSFSFYPSFNLKNHDNPGYISNYYPDKKKISIITKNDFHEKKIKMFDLDLSKNKIKKISLVKKYSFEKNVSYIESSYKGFDNDGLKKNYFAMGTKKNEIYIWETDKLLEEEPFFSLKNNTGESVINKISLIDNLNEYENKKKPYVSCLKWNSETTQFILEGSSIGSIKYWDINKGKKIFEFSLNKLPIFSFNWKYQNRNEFFFLNGSYTSCFSDTRSPKTIYKEFFNERISEIQWLNYDYLYCIIESSGLISLKDIRFQKGDIYSKNIHGRSNENEIRDLKFSFKKKNLMILDNKGYLKKFFLTDLKIKKVKSEKIEKYLSKDFFWLDTGKEEVIIITNDDGKFSFF
jgi:WD40 repeat protein